MLHFILGRAGSGKTKYVRNMLSEKLNNGEKDMLLLVPEQFSFESEKMMLEAVGAQKMLNIDILSFSRLANGIIENTPYASLPRVDDGGRAVILRLALDSVADEVKIYKKFKTNYNGLSQILSFIREMKQCDISVDELNEKSTFASGILNEKIKELSLIFNSYESFMSEDYFDDYNILSVANEYLIENGYFKNKTVVLDAFTGYTAQEIKIVETVLTQAKDVYMTLCTDSFDGYGEYSPFAFINATAKRVVSIAQKHGIEIEKTVLTNTDPNRYTPELSHLEKNLYAPSPEIFEGEAKSIEIIKCENRLDECDTAAREIKRLMREEGVRCRDIAVFERSNGTYDNLLSFMFKKYDIPFFEDDRMPISRNPLVMAARYALKIASRGADTDSILSLLKTEMTSISDEEIDLIENYCFVWSIKASDWKKVWTGNPEGFDAYMDAENEKMLETINAVREKVYGWISSFRNSFKDGNGKMKSEAVYGFLKNIGADVRLRELARFLLEKGESAVALEQENVWDTLMLSLNTLASVSGEKTLSSKQYAELFEVIISSVTVGTVPQGFDNVAIADAQRSRLSSPDYLFILGLNDGEFPQDMPSGGVFTELERRTLIENGIELLPACDGRFAEERYIAYHALTSASKKLYLLYNSGSGEAGSDSPSEVIDNVRTVFPNVTDITSRKEHSVDEIESEQSAFYALTSTWNDKTDYADRLKAYFSGRKDYSGILGSIDRLTSGDKTKTEISDRNTALSLFKKDLYLSASKMEEFYKCPFRYFCRYGIGVTPLRKADIDASISGTIIHRCLEIMIKKYGRGIGSVSPEKRRKEVLKILDDFAAERMDSNNGKSARFMYNFNYHADIICRLIDRLINEFEFSDFTPVEFELPIRPDADIKPYEVLASDGSKVSITGFIDRVDVLNKNNKNYVRIVDYKSGKKEFDKSDIALGLNCQMFIYLFALWKNGGKKFPDFVPSGVLYFRANDFFADVKRDMTDEQKQSKSDENNRMSGVVLDNDEVILGMDKKDSGAFIPVTTAKKGANAMSLEEFERFREIIEEAVSFMAVRLHEGFIPIYPVSKGGKKPCTYCDYKAVCGIDENDAVRTEAYGEVTDSGDSVEQ